MKIKCKCGYTLTVVYDTIQELKYHLGRNHEFDDMDLALLELIFKIHEKIEELEKDDYDYRQDMIIELKSLLD